MFARTLALLAAGSLAIAPVPALAQQQRADKTPTANIPTTEEQQGADLLLMLGAVVGAALLAFLAMQFGGHDTPASP